MANVLNIGVRCQVQIQDCLFKKLNVRVTIKVYQSVKYMIRYDMLFELARKNEGV